MCGNNGIKTAAKWGAGGSPPHVREQLKNKPDYVKPMRITPACAGTTLIFMQLYIDIQDHPRMCGNNLHLSDSNSDEVGSPPHVREQLKFCLKTFLRLRITPACAGTTI